MTFLATVDGRLEPGHGYGPGPCPAPWAFRCDGCGVVKPYQCVLLPGEDFTPDRVLNDRGDHHLCVLCARGFEQLGLGLA